MRRRLLALHRDDRGTTLPLVIYLAIAFFIFVMFISNVGGQASERIEIQNDVDSATLSGGTILARGMNLISESNVSMVQTLALAILVDALNRHDIVGTADALLAAWDKTADALLSSSWPPTIIFGAILKVKVVQERIALLPVKFIVQSGMRKALIGDGPPDASAEYPQEGLLWWAAWGFDKFSDLVYYGFPLWAFATTEQVYQRNRPGADASQGEVAVLLPPPPLLRLPVEKGKFGDLYDRTARKMREWRDQKDAIFQATFLLSQYWSMYKVNTEHILEELFTGEKRGPPEKPPMPDHEGYRRAQEELGAAVNAERRAEAAFLDAARRLAAEGSAQAAAAAQLRAAIDTAVAKQAARDEAERAFGAAIDRFRSNPTGAGREEVSRANDRFQAAYAEMEQAFAAVERARDALDAAVAEGARREPPVQPSEGYLRARDDFDAAAQELASTTAAANAASEKVQRATEQIESVQGRGPEAKPFEPSEGQQFLGRRFPRPYMLVKDWKRYYYHGVGRARRRPPWLPTVMPNRSFPGMESLGNPAYACIELANATATDTFTPDWYAKLSRANPALLAGVLDAVGGEGSWTWLSTH